ncbi:MAG TPA: endonuclease/exonuclease/phosphatase family protein [Edaphocola sp.]|nr:endonuclease/exonuclease/phosphatase family protein [Edaphocola sp.]
MKKLLLLFCCCWPLLCPAQDSLSVMFYNLYRFPVNVPANREFLLKEIVNEVRPDLLLACEIVDHDGAQRILQASFRGLPDTYAAPDFQYCPTATDDPLQQMAYYNTRKLVLLHQEALHTLVRDINHYSFMLNNPDPGRDTVFLDAFVTHLKAGDGPSDSWLRATMADTFVQALRNIPPGHHVLLAGDFNFYDDQEPAYLIMTDTDNPVVMVDPIGRPGDWHNNPDFKDIHTQATRKTLGGFGIGGASGGMDDRFDFILMSKNLANDDQLYYLPGSYRVVGNNGSCFDRAIDNDSCFGLYSLSFRHILFQMSDHAPVVMTLLTTNHFPTSVSGIPGAQAAAISFPGGNHAGRHLKVLLERRAPAANDILVIYDISGRVLKQMNCPVFQDTYTINTAAWAPGMYFIRFRDEVAKFSRD